MTTNPMSTARCERFSGRWSLRKTTPSRKFWSCTSTTFTWARALRGADGGQYYFGKDVSELSVAECASLIAITNNPSKYGPMYDITITREDGSTVTPRELNKSRQELILSKMAEVEGPLRWRILIIQAAGRPISQKRKLRRPEMRFSNLRMDLPPRTTLWPRLPMERLRTTTGL